MTAGQPSHVVNRVSRPLSGGSSKLEPMFDTSKIASALTSCGVVNPYADAMTELKIREHAALVALLRSLPKGRRWGDVTEALLQTGSASAMQNDQTDQALIPDESEAAHLRRALDDVRDWSQKHWQFLSILDATYPARLRDIHQAPPFLFARGELRDDDPAISIVGSRKATESGRSIARSVATELAREGITVLSGLADGIDGTAHRAALDAGGRTVAIIGTGIARSYPAAHRDLQEQIATEGLLLSQFWPEGPPQPHNFIMRNAVMSGYGRATFVVEATENSGTRAQARMVIGHGRPVILTQTVAGSTEWGRRLVGRPGVQVASNLPEAMESIHSALAQENQVDELLQELVSGST